MPNTDLKIGTLLRVREHCRKNVTIRHNGEYGIFQSQTWTSSNVIWTPVVNVCRDPRWGRCQETLGEDPYLTSQLGAVLVKSFQHGGLDGDKYLQVIATAKHFDVHGGPESASLDAGGNRVNTNRMTFDTKISRRVSRIAGYLGSSKSASNNRADRTG